MTSWTTEMNYSETESEFYDYCQNKYLELNTIFTQKHNEGVLVVFEYKLCIIWGLKGDYSIRKEYIWKY
jgi:hypothetical protein